MNPDDDDAVISQLKHPRFQLEVTPKSGVDFIRATENRRLTQTGKPSIHLQACAEDELVKKEYKELRCQIPGIPRSTFLMAFSPDGTKVASTHGNHNIYVTDLRSGRNIKTLMGHPRTPWCIAFHPTCNELVASGCLGGQVRIWDLSGGSEVWTAGNQTVIASIAFHPNDRILVIATYNELFFWDWSKPKPFASCATNNTKEKVRYVTFDKLGHKLITGIANTPQSRWERSRSNTQQNRWERARTTAPVSSRPIAIYRRGVIPRIYSYYHVNTPQQPPPPPTSTTNSDRVPLSSVPERERRITACYRNLVHEYELLVHRYLQVYRPPTTMDRGTDPMETDVTRTSSGTSTTSLEASQPTTSLTTAIEAQNSQASTSSPRFNTSEQTSSTETSPRRRLVMRATLGVQTSTESSPTTETSNSGYIRASDPNFSLRISCAASRKTPFTSPDHQTPPRSSTTESSQPGPSVPARPGTPSPSETSNQSVPNNNMREVWRNQLKRLYPGYFKKVNKNNRKPILETSSENSSSDEEDRTKRRFVAVSTGQGSAFDKTTPRNQPSKESDRTQTSFTNPVSSSSLASTTTGSTSLCQPHSVTPSSSPHAPPRTKVDQLVCLANVVANRTVPNGMCDMCSITQSRRETQSSSNNNTGNSVVEDNRGVTPQTETTAPATANFSTTTTECHTNPILSTSSANNNAGTTEPRSVVPACARTLMNTNTRTTNSTVYTESLFATDLDPDNLFPHGMSAFLPACVLEPAARLRRLRRLNPAVRVLNLDSFEQARDRSVTPFTPNDELINYSERTNSEEDLTENTMNLPDFHPFDPPPEFPSINPENIGIGNMYSNIVQDLETSLDNVRNIRASTRPGETSDMLSNFSERLDSIMRQSEAVLRNLRNTIDMLPSNSNQNESAGAPATTSATFVEPRNVELDNPRFLFNDPNFYVRDQNQNNNNLDRSSSSTSSNNNGNTNRAETTDSFTGEELYNNRSAIASDHTYPRNPDNSRTVPTSSANLTPLMTSLHLTISHIQRQARLLRLQVDSIERIDRAMLEVAQLQTIRQLFGDVRSHLNSLNCNDNRNTGVSSVRQMMAGTRISDSSPCDSPAEDELNQNQSNAQQQQRNNNPDGSTASTSTSTGAPSGTNNPQIPRQRMTTRKSFPPSRLLQMQRQNRRFSIVNLLPRRHVPMERLSRRRVYFRSFSLRPNASRVPARLPADLGGYIGMSSFNSESLALMARKLEHLLTEHIKLIGTGPESPTGRVRFEPRYREPNQREIAINERLNNSRMRVNRLPGARTTNDVIQACRVEINSAPPDAASRFNARDTLSVILDCLTRYLLENNGSNISVSLRAQVRNVIDLTLLLCDILLLHIVDSIPPPTGMNLDPERESLSARIDHMCSRMLQNRMTAQSHNLTRSLRLMRLTARYATRALGQTYNAHRTAFFASGHSSRRELLGQITSTLHNMNRNRTTPLDMPSTSDGYPYTLPEREWYQTINAFVTRYNATVNEPIFNFSSSNSSSSSDQNSRFGEEANRRAPIYDEPTTNSDENDDTESYWYNNNLSNSRTQQLYRTNNVNLLNNEESPSSSSHNRSWNVPMVQINDVPISESNTTWHSRITQHRYRLSDLRSNPSGSVFRPRFLHPLYAGVNPFDTDLDDPQREQMYDADMILTVTPNHRIQLWDISTGIIPDISNSMKNVVVGECRIHNDASVDMSEDGTILVTLLPSGGYLNVTNRLGVYSLRWETLGQCLYITSFEQNAVSVSLSPLSRHLVVGLASRRVSIVQNDKWTMARIFLLNQNEMPYGSRLPVLREIEQNRDTSYMSLNCIRWLPVSGQGLIYATNTGQLRILT